MLSSKFFLILNTLTIVCFLAALALQIMEASYYSLTLLDLFK